MKKTDSVIFDGVSTKWGVTQDESLRSFNAVLDEKNPKKKTSNIKSNNVNQNKGSSNPTADTPKNEDTINTSAFLRQLADIKVVPYIVGILIYKSQSLSVPDAQYSDLTYIWPRRAKIDFRIQYDSSMRVGPVLGLWDQMKHINIRTSPPKSSIKA